jgi:hypothetical protein
VIRSTLVGILFAIAQLPSSAEAQEPILPRITPEARADVIFGRDPAVHVGAGAQVPAGYYVRVGIDVAAGVSAGDRLAPSGSADGRLDLLARFLLDPFRQSRFGLSVGGGLSLRAMRGDRVRPHLLVALDVEGRRWSSGLVPALQVGLGGGARVGMVLRRGAVRAR